MWFLVHCTGDLLGLCWAYGACRTSLDKEERQKVKLTARIAFKIEHLNICSVGKNENLIMINRSWIRKKFKKRVKENRYLRYAQLMWPDYRLWLRKAGTLPSFLIIGAQRAGTTFLHEKIVDKTSAKPSPLQKEVHYFDNKYYKRKKWYRKFFGVAKENIKNFETSPYYLYHPAAPKRVKESIPNIKLIVILRDPIKRAISHYKWMRQSGLESRGAVDAFRYDAEKIKLENDKSYLKKFHNPLYFDFDHIYRSYIRRSLYHIQIKRWKREFNFSNIMVLTSHELFNDTKKVVKKLSKFVGLEYTSSNGVVKRNESNKNINISDEAYKIVEKYLSGVWEKVRKEVPGEIVKDS